MTSKEANPETREPEAPRAGGRMVVEQMLKDWLAERASAVDLSVAARSVRSMATEVDAHYHDLLARARAETMDRAQHLAEKEVSLDKALDVIAKLESQLAQLRDRTDRMLASRDHVIEQKDSAGLATLQTIGKLEAQFGAAREKLEGKLEKVEDRLEKTARELAERRETLAAMEKELEDKGRVLEDYRQKFGVIIKAVK